MLPLCDLELTSDTFHVSPSLATSALPASRLFHLPQVTSPVDCSFFSPCIASLLFNSVADSQPSGPSHPVPNPLSLIRPASTKPTETSSWSTTSSTDRTTGRWDRIPTVRDGRGRLQLVGPKETLKSQKRRRRAGWEVFAKERRLSELPFLVRSDASRHQADSPLPSLSLPLSRHSCPEGFSAESFSETDFSCNSFVRPSAFFRLLKFEPDFLSSLSHPRPTNICYYYVDSGLLDLSDDGRIDTTNFRLEDYENGCPAFAKNSTTCSNVLSWVVSVV